MKAIATRARSSNPSVIREQVPCLIVSTLPRPSKAQAEPIVAVAAIRAGHWNSLNAMFEPEFSRIVELFNRASEIGGTYFRLVAKGFQPVDLDPSSKKPLMGVGGPFSPRSSAATIETELPARVACLLAKRRTQKRSLEKVVEAFVVRAALRRNLRLDGFGPNLRFVASQWRIDLGGRGKPLDLLAVDIQTKALVVIELKATKDHRACRQASGYAEKLRRHAEVTGPFFAKLGLAMGRLYECSDLPDVLVPGLVNAFAPWPTGSSTYEVVPCP
jgi:hypothetical protein